MMDKEDPTQIGAKAEERPELTAEAKRALAEAEQRRTKAAKEAERVPKEVGRREGPEPTRYGDWEKGGIASDF